MNFSSISAKNSSSIPRPGTKSVRTSVFNTSAVFRRAPLSLSRVLAKKRMILRRAGRRLAFLQSGVKRAVDECGALLGGKMAGQFDRLVDDNLRRRVGAGHFPNGQTDEIAIDARLAARRPLRGDSLDPAIDAGPLLPNAGGHVHGGFANLKIFRTVGDDLLGQRAVGRSLRVPHKQDLHRQLSNFASFGHVLTELYAICEFGSSPQPFQQPPPPPADPHGPANRRCDPRPADACRWSTRQK